MIVVLPKRSSPGGFSIWQEENRLLALNEAGVVIDEICMEKYGPNIVYSWVQVWACLEKHDFKLEIEYPPMHRHHPAGELPTLCGETRIPYLHIFE